MNSLRIILMALVAMLMLGQPLLASPREELQERFKQRFEQLQKFKADGKAGETFTGYIEAVKTVYANEPAIGELLKAENADRRALYDLIARETGVSADDVAKRNAARNFQRAGKGEWLKHADGIWRQRP